MATRRFEQKSLTPPPLELAAPISSPDHRKRKSRREGPIFRIFPHHQRFPSSSNGRNANHVFFSCRQKHVRAFATYQTYSFPLDNHQEERREVDAFISGHSCLLHYLIEAAFLSTLSRLHSTYRYMSLIVPASSAQLQCARGESHYVESPSSGDGAPLGDSKRHRKRGERVRERAQSADRRFPPSQNHNQRQKAKVVRHR